METEDFETAMEKAGELLTVHSWKKLRDFIFMWIDEKLSTH